MAVFPASSLFLILLVVFAAAQSPNETASTDFTWSADSPAACETYVTYHVRSPYLDIGSISDLFGTSRMDIAAATGMATEDALLVPGQVLLVPIKCTSNGTHYFSNVTYRIKEGDSFYSVSVKPFQNLTNYYAVEEMNPTLKATNLTVGVDAVFPLFCKCPQKLYIERGIQYLITYVWQPGNDVVSVSDMFQASPSDIVMENNNRNFTAAICFPVLVPVKYPVILKKLPSAAGIGNAKHHQIFTAILAAIVAFLIVSFVLAVYFHLLYKKNKKLVRVDSSLEASNPVPACELLKDETFKSKTVQDKLLPGVSGCLGKLIMYDPQVIAKATMNFSERFKLGGSVYKAVIDERIFAVKQAQDSTEELQILQRVNHANLVTLIGISSHNEGHIFLVYEYAEKGSLDKWLFPKEPSSSDKAEPLCWNQRLSIALDVANSLQYLHEHTQPSVVHNNICTKNILLDSNFRAKISNFTSAKSVTTCSTILIVDVFAFGAILLELLSGKRAVETRENGEVVMLWNEVNEILEGEEQRNVRLRQWMDPKLKNCYPLDDAVSLAMLGRACTSDKFVERPRMAEVVFNLCILTQSCHHKYGNAWFSQLGAEEVFSVISTVDGR